MTQSFLALGDSYTIGEGVEAGDRWPVRLASHFRNAGVAFPEPRIIARTGWTTDELLAAIEVEKVAGRWDLVTLLVGVNDQYRGHGVVRFRESMAAVVAKALSLAKLSSDLVVISIPDWGVTPFAEGRDRLAIGHEIDSFNAVARGLAIESGARFVDITRVSRRAETDRTLLAADGLHPSPAMYELWVEQLLPLFPLEKR